MKTILSNFHLFVLLIFILKKIQTHTQLFNKILRIKFNSEV